MVVRLTIPLGKDDNVKNLVFSILANEYPLKIIEITNLIRKRYGKTVSFQAVRKSLFELIEEGIIIKDQRSFSLNKNWVFETKYELEKIYNNLTKEKVKLL